MTRRDIETAYDRFHRASRPDIAILPGFFLFCIVLGQGLRYRARLIQHLLK